MSAEELLQLRQSHVTVMRSPVGEITQRQRSIAGNNVQRLERALYNAHQLNRGLHYRD